MLKHKVLTHYIPLLICCIYLPCILLYLIFFFPCEQNFNYTEFECGIPCYVDVQPFGILNEVIHILVPASIIVIFNALILIRIIAIKKRTASSSSSNNLWKQNRRMILQLAAIALSISLAWIPYVIIIMVEILANPAFGSRVFFDFINATYIPSLCTPFFVVIGFPQEIREKMFTCVRT